MEWKCTPKKFVRSLIRIGGEKMNREDFPLLKQDIIYFDNGATALKPDVLAKATVDYYHLYSANAHRGDYDMSMIVDAKYEEARSLVKDFIHAESESQIVFTSGATDSLNKIVFGYYKNMLTEKDEVLLTKSEHASNILPWFELRDQLHFKIRYIPLDQDHKVTLENVKKVVNENTKVISIAHITNVVGDVRPLKEIISYAHEKKITVVVDGAQSVAHMVVDVKDLDVDFLAFSAHKVYGPTGLGILYGKKEVLENVQPIFFGGGMNASFSSDGIRMYDELPSRLEAGTQNIAGVIGFGSVLKYLKEIGMEKIQAYEKELHAYAISKLKEIKEVILYNKNSESSIIAFNYDGIFAQDLAIYLNKYHICVRAGSHCAKILKDEFQIKNTCRISFAFYNTKEEVDKFIDILKNPNIRNEIL